MFRQERSLLSSLFMHARETGASPVDADKIQESPNVCFDRLLHNGFYQTQTMNANGNNGTVALRGCGSHGDRKSKLFSPRLKRCCYFCGTKMIVQFQEILYVMSGEIIV